MDSQSTTTDEFFSVLPSPGNKVETRGSSSASSEIGLLLDESRQSSIQNHKPDLSRLPPVSVLPTHFAADELNVFELDLIDLGASLTYNSQEAHIFLTKIESRRRATLELRERGVLVRLEGKAEASERFAKRLRHDAQDVKEDAAILFAQHANDHIITIARHTWITDSIRKGTLLSLALYTICSGTRMSKTKNMTQLPAAPTRLERSNTLEKPSRRDGSSHESADKENDASRSKSRKRPHEYSQTTPERDLLDKLPPPPAWVTLGFKYACQRRSPIDNLNDTFISQLKEIRLFRELRSDHIGVRAYSTAIAAVAAYPRKIVSAVEIAQLPGCQGKISALFREFQEVGSLSEIRETDKDAQIGILRLFYDIWGVGSVTAREFYAKGWKDLDDVVEFGWDQLSRVQQIGLKYYDEFKLKMSRAEVEDIHSTIHAALRHVFRTRGGDPAGAKSCLVGGYRRGKEESGDVDVIVSHREEIETLDIIAPLISYLFELGYVTHNLGITISGSRRGQNTLPFVGGIGGGHGFDSLDKALVVWQDLPRNAPDEWHKMTGDEKAQWRKQNPSDMPHRRVDIIITPWSTAGCAVLGWSAGTTFERDLRRYAKYIKRWKFDSSGVRDRVTGKTIDLERRRDGGRADTFEEAERLVFEGLGLEYIPPHERNTG